MTPAEINAWRQVPQHKRPPEARWAIAAAAQAEKLADLRDRLARARGEIGHLRLKVAARDARIRALEELLEDAREPERMVRASE